MSARRSDVRIVLSVQVASCHGAGHRKSNSAMTDYVLSMARGMGAGCWTRVRRRLAPVGIGCSRRTLTGWENAPISERDVDLGTHRGCRQSLDLEDLRDIVLVDTPTAVSSCATLLTGCRTGFARSSIRRLRSRERKPFDYLPDDGEGDRNWRGPWRWLRVPPRPASFSRSMRQTPPGWIVSARCTAVQLEAPAQISGACDDIAKKSDTFWLWL